MSSGYNGSVALPSRGPRHRDFGDALLDHPSRHTLTIVVSPAAATRIEAAHRFVSPDRAADQHLLVGDSREAIDDFAREISVHRRAVFGLHRFSLRQLASKLAEVELARACGVEHPGLVSPDQLEFLDDRFGTRTVADVFASRRRPSSAGMGETPVANRVTLGAFNRCSADRDGQTEA